MFCGARLVELDLSDNAIGPMAMPGLQDFLASDSACELKIINLNNCGLGIAGKVFYILIFLQIIYVKILDNS